MQDWQRTHTCGALRAEHIGNDVVVNGWVRSVRDHGDLVFVDLRDRTGMVQICADASSASGLHDTLAGVKPESVLSIRGIVRRRRPGMENPRLETGSVEIAVTRVDTLNQCRQPLPFQLNDEAQMSLVNEELRLRYRYLDLRRPRLYEMLKLRHEVITSIRSFLNREGFLEIETPLFTRSTPEGARDYLVPYRLEPGLFYALPQSPQQYKQLLMVGGVERYYQIARCFRDEAQRADRQPEFTQLDLEMSFVTQDDILNLTEALTIELITTHSTKTLGSRPFTRLTYDEAIARYGTDKPDLRYGLELRDLNHLFQDTGFSVFRDTIESGGFVRGLIYPGGAGLSRKNLDDLTRFARQIGAKGLVHLAWASDSDSEAPVLQGPAARHLTADEARSLVRAMGAKPGDLILAVADSFRVASAVLGRLRCEIARHLSLAPRDVLHFCWVTDFPLVEWSEDEQRWDASHHPFTMPHLEDLEYLESDPGRVRAQCYDIVCNGIEWGSGSIRIARADIQSRVFALLGISQEIQQERFGHMLEAFAYGAPPHGGIAPGIDRLIMLLTDNDNIREVMAFPKIGGGGDPLMGAPAPVDASQLAELGLQIVPRARDSVHGGDPGSNDRA